MADPRLDLCSDAFDALYALQHHEHVLLPFSNILPLDNVAACHSRMFPKAQQKQQQQQQPSTTAKEASQKKAGTEVSLS